MTWKASSSVPRSTPWTGSGSLGWLRSNPCSRPLKRNGSPGTGPEKGISGKPPSPLAPCCLQVRPAQQVDAAPGEPQHRTASLGQEPEAHSTGRELDRQDYSTPKLSNTSRKVRPARSASRVRSSAATFSSALATTSSAAACGSTTTPSQSPKM